MWDSRKLHGMAVEAVDASSGVEEIDVGEVENFIESPQGRGCLRGEWRHDKSVSSAYWDPRGRGIVSTSYDDNIRRKFCPSMIALLEPLLTAGHAQYGTSVQHNSKAQNPCVLSGLLVAFGTTARLYVQCSMFSMLHNLESTNFYRENG
jgi:hypothetical protein